MRGRSYSHSRALPACAWLLFSMLPACGATPPLPMATGADFPARFKHVKPAEAEQILASLAAVGLALELPPTAGVPRTWQAVR